MPTELFFESIDLDVESLEPVPFGPGGISHPAYPAVPLRRSGRSAMLSFDVLILENPFLRVTIVPGLGGRILSLFDKRTQTEILGTGGSLPLSDEGSRGVWMPAGIQFVVGGLHRLNAMGPVDFVAREADEETSEATVLLHELVLGLGLSWHASISLPPDRAELRIAVKVLNRSLSAQPGVLGLSLECAEGPRLSGDSVAIYDPAGDRGLGLFYEPATFERVLWGSSEEVLYDLYDRYDISDLSSDSSNSTTPLASRRPEAQPQGEPTVRLGEGVASGRGGGSTFRLLTQAEPSPQLQPRQVAGFEVTLIPFSGLGSLDAWSPAGGLSINNDRLKFQAAEELPDHRFFLLTESGETLEAPVHLYPEKLTEIDLKSLPSKPAAFQLRNANKDELMAFDLKHPSKGILPDEVLCAEVITPKASPSGRQLAAAKSVEIAEVDPIEAQRLARLAAKDPATSAQASTQLAHLAIRQHNWAEAQRWLDQAIGANAEDHLAWWTKALVQRLSGESTDDRPELLNAHFLAPLEPLLRAESFLAMPQEASSEPNPMLKAMAQDQEAMIEVACRLLDLNLFQEASRWIDEALRHQEVPMLCYLLAWAYLRETRMEVEAVQLIQRANSHPIQSPYPWRKLELQAIRDLAARYPANQRIANLLQIITPAG